MLVPFISLFVLPIAWFEGLVLPKATWTGWAVILTLVNALVLYTPWAIAVVATRHLMINPVAVLGFFMLGEVVGQVQVVGMFLLFIGVILFSRKKEPIPYRCC